MIQFIGNADGRVLFFSLLSRENRYFIYWLDTGTFRSADSQVHANFSFISIWLQKDNWKQPVMTSSHLCFFSFYYILHHALYMCGWLLALLLFLSTFFLSRFEIFVFPLLFYVYTRKIYICVYTFSCYTMFIIILTFFLLAVDDVRNSIL